MIEEFVSEEWKMNHIDHASKLAIRAYTSKHTDDHDLRVITHSSLVRAYRELLASDSGMVLTTSMTQGDEEHYGLRATRPLVPISHFWDISKDISKEPRPWFITD